MSVYAEVLAIAQRQTALAGEGQIEAAIALIDDREALLASAPPTTESDLDTLREILRLDKDLATAIRYRMIAVRDETVSVRHGQKALVGYRPPLGARPSRRLNAVG